MANMELIQQANVNRSIRTIKAELEYLCDASIISPQTLSSLLQQIPPQTAIHAPISVGAVPQPAQNIPSNDIRTPMNNLNLNSTQNEKNDPSYFQPAPSPQQPPPAYNSPPPQASWPGLAQATALYAYQSADEGDLALAPNDKITVTEYLNAEWWKGRKANGEEGIFPRSYVRVEEEKKGATGVQNSNTNTYGNMPLEVSGVGNGANPVPSKAQEQGKKFGKKLGNAAIFGAGATIGSNIVNSVF